MNSCLDWRPIDMQIAAGAPRHCEFRTIALTVMPGLSRPSTSFNHAAGSHSITSIDPPARHSYIDVEERTPTAFGASEDV